MEQRESNYEVMKHRMQARFAEHDMEAICREWELAREDGSMLLTLVGRQYRIDPESGAVYWKEEGTEREADFNVSMTIFDMLTRPRAAASGEMTSISSLSRVYSASAPGKDIFDRTAGQYLHRCGQLSAACERLGGVPYTQADVSYLLPVFRDLSIAVRFWDGDEEFGPAFSFLCDKNILRFMHYETLMYLLCHISDRLCGLADAADDAR